MVCSLFSSVSFSARVCPRNDLILFCRVRRSEGPSPPPPSLPQPRTPLPDFYSPPTLERRLNNMDARCPLVEVEMRKVERHFIGRYGDLF